MDLNVAIFYAIPARADAVSCNRCGEKVEIICAEVGGLNGWRYFLSLRCDVWTMVEFTV